MPILYAGNTLPISVPSGQTLVVKELTGTVTVAGSSATREDASSSIGAGFVVYGPQPSTSSLSVSTTGICEWQIVNGDATPPKDAFSVTPYGTASPDSLQVLANSGISSGIGADRRYLAVTASGVTNLDLSSGKGFDVTIIGNATSKFIGISPLAEYDFTVTLRNDTTVGHTWAWPVGVRWVGGVKPDIPYGPHASATYRFRSAAGSYTFTGEAVSVNAATSTLFSDAFSDAASTALSSRTTAVGAATWANVASATFVTDGSGSAYSSTNADGDRAYIDIGRSDFTYRVTTTAYFTNGSDPSTRNTCGVMFRYVDASNFWYAEVDPYNSGVFLYRVLAGVYVKMATYAIAKTSAVPHVVQIDCLGPNITLSIDGADKATYVDANHQTATKVGFRTGKNANSPATKPLYSAFSVSEFSYLPIKHPAFSKPYVNPVIPKGTGSQWNATDLNNPNVVWDPVNSRYVTDGSGYYNSGPDDGIQHQGFYYATNLDATTWTADAANPVYLADGLDGRYAFNGGLVWVESLKLWVNAIVSAAGSSIRLFTMPSLGAARTDRGLIVVPTPGTPYSVGAFDPSLRIRQDGQIEMWFCAKAGRRTICKGIINTETWKFALGTGTQPVLIPPTALFAEQFVGEPWCYVPPGMEDIQAMVFFDGQDSPTSASASRRIATATTLDGGKSWHYRVNAIAPVSPGSGTWETNQNFDCCVYDAGDGFLRSYYSGASLPGAALNLNIQIGLAKAPWPAGQGFI